MPDPSRKRRPERARCLHGVCDRRVQGCRRQQKSGCGCAGSRGRTEGTPVQVGASTGWAQVDTGNPLTCAVRVDGTLWCRGYGIFGGGKHTQSLVPLEVGHRSNWADVSTGQGNTCALSTAGALWCWGYNADGEVGDGTRSGCTGTGRPGRRSEPGGPMADSPTERFNATLQRHHFAAHPGPRPPARPPVALPRVPLRESRRGSRSSTRHRRGLRRHCRPGENDSWSRWSGPCVVGIGRGSAADAPAVRDQSVGGVDDVRVGDAGGAVDSLHTGMTSSGSQQ
jgi:hypothetical protein